MSNLKLYEYQEQGVNWLRSRFRAILADEMGLGKTVIMIEVINQCRGIKKVLVVCPASLKLNWEAEFKTWLSRDMDVTILSGAPKKTDSLSGICIINYDILVKWEKLLKEEWDFIIFDEAHYIKNIKSKRTKVAMKLKANRITFLTGTPMLNRPKELFNMLNKIGIFDDRKKFETRYCEGRLVRKFGRLIWDNDGASNLAELGQKLSPVMLRRLKKDVLLQLPEKIHQVIQLGCEDVLSSEEVEWFDGLPKSGSVTPDVRRLAGEVKVEASVKFIEEVLEHKQKLVVFAHHKTVISRLAEGLGGKYSVQCITGDTSMSDRHQRVKDFQTKTQPVALICNIQAAGVGLTMTAADTVIFVELDWVPGNMSQAEDRLHRIGQKNSVQVIYLVAPGADADIGAALAKKLKNIEVVYAKDADGIGEADAKGNQHQKNGNSEDISMPSLANTN